MAAGASLANLVPLGWIGIIRLGLVQTALGAIVVLTTSTLNRVMVVELALPATLPGLLVAIHYAVQVMRPRMGYGSDIGGRLTGWIVGGMAVLALGGLGAAVATAWMTTNVGAGIALAMASFLAIGLGVGAAGTSLLVLLAKRVDAHRRAAAATIVWLMMIAGFAVTATVAGHLLDPFSPARLIAVTAGVSGCAWLLSVVAVAGLEGRGPDQRSRAVLAGVESEDRATAHAYEAADATSVTTTSSISKPSFRAALAQVWSEPEARRFAIFIFVSMLAYSAQDLILEPFAGAVFGATPGESTKLSGVQHAGVFVGMLVVALVATAIGGSRLGSLRAWTIGGCIASALALASLAVAGFVGPAFPLRPAVFALGVANGVYAVAAIGSMMGMAGSGRAAREGTRMGLWGAAQAVAFGMGGLAGTMASDLARYLLGSPLAAYSTVFAAEAMLFLVASVLAVRVGRRGVATANATSTNAATVRTAAAETQNGYAPEMSLR